MCKESVLNIIRQTGLIAIIRNIDIEVIDRIAKSLIDGGVRAVEITMNTPNVLKIINRIKTRFGESGIVIGAGTVLDSETARAAILAGSEYIITPSVEKDVIKLCNRYDKMIISGAMTPTEIITAIDEGADMVKVFPANVMGPEYIKSLKGPLPQLNLVPTGGIGLDNAKKFMDAGSFALAVGGGLIDKQAIEKKDFNLLTNRAKEFINIVKRYR